MIGTAPTDAGKSIAPGALRCDIDLDGLPDFTDEKWDLLMNIDAEEWRREVISQNELSFCKATRKLPVTLRTFSGY
jgi:hypothetical protein